MFMSYQKAASCVKFTAKRLRTQRMLDRIYKMNEIIAWPEGKVNPKHKRIPAKKAAGQHNVRVGADCREVQRAQ